MSGAKGRLQPDVLPETVKDFPIPEKELIALCKKYSQNPAISVEGSTPTSADESIFAPDFKFEGPLIKLNRKKYLDAVRTFDFAPGFPNIALNAYDYRVDKYEPHRVWYTMRVSGNHTGTCSFFGRKIPPTGRKVLGSPECASMTFNRDGKITCFTAGYVIDNRLGNCNGLGGLGGILSSLGIYVPFPHPGTLGWKIGIAVDSVINYTRLAIHFFTFGIFREKPKVA